MLAARTKAAHARRTLDHSQADLFGYVKAAPVVGRDQIMKWAAGIWRASMPSHHSTLAERWAASKNLRLPEDIHGETLRFHPALRFGDAKAAALVFLLRDLRNNDVTGVLRLFIDANGAEIGRRVLGSAWNGSIKLSDRTDADKSLFIASSVEAGLGAVNVGLRPLWSVVGASALADFPLIPGIDSLNVIGGDPQAVAAVWRRYREHGRDVAVCALPRSED